MDFEWLKPWFFFENHESIKNPSCLLIKKNYFEIIWDSKLQVPKNREFDFSKISQTLTFCSLASFKQENRILPKIMETGFPEKFYLGPMEKFQTKKFFFLLRPEPL